MKKRPWTLGPKLRLRPYFSVSRCLKTVVTGWVASRPFLLCLWCVVSYVTFFNVSEIAYLSVIGVSVIFLPGMQCVIIVNVLYLPTCLMLRVVTDWMRWRLMSGLFLADVALWMPCLESRCFRSKSNILGLLLLYYSCTVSANCSFTPSMELVTEISLH